MDIVPLFRALADERRITILAALIAGPRTVEAIAAHTEIPPHQVVRHLGMLQSQGLVIADGQGSDTRYRFERGPLLTALTSLADAPPPAPDGTLDDFDRRVLTTFMDGDRLTTIPVGPKKREPILRHLANRFEPDRPYDEREVNAILKPVHDDVASLRRYLVDGGYLQREIVREPDASSPGGNVRVVYRKCVAEDTPL